jgi:hypothetical protein
MICDFQQIQGGQQICFFIINLLVCLERGASSPCVVGGASSPPRP